MLSVQDFTDVFQVYPDNHWFFFLFSLLLRPNKKISVFRVMGPKILSKVGTHIILINYFFILEKIEFYAF